MAESNRQGALVDVITWRNHHGNGNQEQHGGAKYVGHAE